MGLPKGTIVDILAITWLQFCDGCLIGAIMLKFDLIAHELDPIIQLSKAKNGPDFGRWIAAMQVEDQGHGTHKVENLFNALVNGINQLAENTLVNFELYI